ncbi:unnamed protein product [Discosporangium mesarthrocarpum]
MRVLSAIPACLVVPISSVSAWQSVRPSHGQLHNTAGGILTADRPVKCGVPTCGKGGFLAESPCSPVSECALVQLGKRYMWSLSMSTTGGDVVERCDVKAGPLKQESIPLSTGVSMETLSQGPSNLSSKRRKELPPLVFIHGSYHAAWCWAEHWMPFLAGKGYQTYSISLRGSSGTEPPLKERKSGWMRRDKGNAKRVKIMEHVEDVKSFVQTVLPGQKPVFISHSFGGVVLLKLLESQSAAVDEGSLGDMGVSGSVFLCSVPPSGNGPMSRRFLKERPVAALKIVVGFVLKLAVHWPWLARELFFCTSIEQSTLGRYMANFRADSKMGLDLVDLQKKLPSRTANEEGKAAWLPRAPPRLVMGGERDYIVDEKGVEEMATFLDTNYIMLPVVAHEVMLGPDWPIGISRLINWLEVTDFKTQGGC